MASRERLGHLKFMQRAKLREEEKSKQQETQDNGDQWVSDRKPLGSSCVVIVEGDPKPSSTSGRMSFRSFNPSFEVSSVESVKSSKPTNSDQETIITSSMLKFGYRIVVTEDFGPLFDASVRTLVESERNSEGLLTGSWLLNDEAHKK
ncbi:hypothetical protein R1flu_010564 [Riccia fluitans]|uniref:Uncharacterized protein n=1 Tax=Riccia fluitans TaxID=41844 RepID=A0ABD1Z9I1_9MARC